MRKPITAITFPVVCPEITASVGRHLVLQNREARVGPIGSLLFVNSESPRPSLGRSLVPRRALLFRAPSMALQALKLDFILIVAAGAFNRSVLKLPRFSEGLRHAAEEFHWRNCLAQFLRFSFYQLGHETADRSPCEDPAAGAARKFARAFWSGAD